MKEEHARFLTDEEIFEEVKYLSEHQEEMLSESKERDAWFSDPRNSSVIEAEQAKMDLVIALYNARKEAGLTQKELAERLGTNQSYIAQLEICNCVW